MKRNFRFGTVTAESYLGLAPDTTILPTQQVREEMAMFAAAFAAHAGVEHQSFSDLIISMTRFRNSKSTLPVSAFTRWDEKAGLQRDAIRSQ
jgi:hypothetical protein